MPGVGLRDGRGGGATTTTTGTSICSSPACVPEPALRNRGDGRFEDVTGRRASPAATGPSPADGSITTTTAASICSSSTTCNGRRTRTRPAATRRADLHLLPSAHLPGTAEPAVSQPRRRHVRGRVGARGPAGARRQGHERVVRGLRSRRPSRHLRHQRHGAQLSLPQQWRRHVHGNGAPRRGVGARHRAGRPRAWAPIPRTTTTTAGRTSTSPRSRARRFRSSATTAHVAGRSSR